MSTKLIGFRIEEELLNKLKHAAVDEGLSMQELLKRAAEAYLATLRKKSKRK
jgi:predicted DNA binding CopG/RHH family protein